MTFEKKNYYTALNKAKDLVPGFREAFLQFEQRVILDQSSPSLLSNYGRNLAHLALHFGQVPHLVSVEEIRSIRNTEKASEALVNRGLSRNFAALRSA